MTSLLDCVFQTMNIAYPSIYLDLNFSVFSNFVVFGIHALCMSFLDLYLVISFSFSVTIDGTVFYVDVHC